MKHFMRILGAFLLVIETIQCSHNKTHFVIGQSGKPVKTVSPQTTLQQKHVTTHRVFFSPTDDVRTHLISLINNEKKSIKVSIFMFTDKDIAHALIDASRRGVKVAIIVDGAAGADRFSKIDMLKRAGVDVFEYKPQTQTGMNNDIMHHKFVIFESNQDDCSLLWTGSCNFTRSASARNRENVIVLDDTEVIQQFEQEFERLKKIIAQPKHHMSQNKRAGRRTGKLLKKNVIC